MLNEVREFSTWAFFYVGRAPEELKSLHDGKHDADD